MPRKLDVLNRLDRERLVLILRLDDPEEVMRVAKHAIEGGITMLEVPLTTPGALDAIELLATEYGPQVVVGAGTVLDGNAAYAAINAGASFLVSPQLNPEMLALANRYQITTICGAYTPTEMLQALTHGADVVKLFPTDGGPAFAKAILAPLPQVPVIPAGGATPENVAEWFDAGVVGVGAGSYITKAAAESGDYNDVTAAATTLLQAVRGAPRHD
ncbi:MAG: bifunctional 4-hydroxy-2-oxoglutarate aldolase/2-dehydro-3-deoxy-phosphogluconate aldolase [Beutenbergiaceae bacterium]